MYASRASPHTRGWTHVRGVRRLRGRGFPAHAGMDPTPGRGKSSPSRLPRTRGDGPCRRGGAVNPGAASPHTRGWTLPVGRLRGPGEGFPAHAGMDPPCRLDGKPLSRLPRTRGDGPEVSPLFRICGKASPHTRGWTRPAGSTIAPKRGFPAHAGMDPSRSSASRRHSRLPRTRGDGPSTRVANPRCGAASPHTRGWTRRSEGRDDRVVGFPAHAGMDRSTC